MKIVFTLVLVLLSLISSYSQIPYQYGWPRQASDDFGLYKNSPTIADIDKDGSLDISVTENIVASGHMPKLSVFKRNGTYVPYFPQSFPFGSLQSSGSREISAMGDVLGDDKLEIIFGDENGNIHVYQYNGQIPAGAPVNVGSNQQLNTPALVDLDNDGKCEIIITSSDRDNDENGSLHVLKYSGTSFVELTGFPKNFPFGCESSPVVGDLDNDNQYEIVYLNGGSLTAGVYSAINAIELDGTIMQGFPIEFHHSSSGNTPSLYDLDKNGTLEIVIRLMEERTQVNGVYAYDYHGNLLPHFPFLINYGHPDANVAIGDIDGDGVPELAYGSVTAVDSGLAWVWKLDGTVMPGFPQRIWATWVDGSVAIGDVSGDSLNDVIVPTSKGFIYAFKFDGSIVEGFPLAAEDVYVVKGFETSPTLVDIDNDGDMEIFAGSLNKRVYGWDTPGKVTNTGWSTFKGNAQRTGGMLKGFMVTPVELTNFTAVNDGKNNVVLSWSTKSELNNVGFELQKSFNGNEYETISFIQGNGTSTNEHNYSFVDKNLSNGKYNYRLKQIDMNGSYKFYVLQNEVNIDMPLIFSLAQNYPNPFNPETKISFSLPEQANVQLRIYDVTGSEIKTLINEAVNAGNHSINFNAADLPSGIYVYKIIANYKNGFFSDTKKMVLMK